VIIIGCRVGPQAKTGRGLGFSGTSTCFGIVHLHRWFTEPVEKVDLVRRTGRDRCGLELGVVRPVMPELGRLRQSNSDADVNMSPARGSSRFTWRLLSVGMQILGSSPSFVHSS
jgi:hypothetical protein